MLPVETKKAADLLDQSLRQPLMVQGLEGQSFVVVSPDEYQHARAQAFARLRDVCEEVGKQAEVNGLTEQQLAELLAEE